MHAASFEFLGFAGIVLVLFYSIPIFWRKYLVLIAGYLFYFFLNANYVWLLFLLSNMVYFTGIYSAQSKHKRLIIKLAIPLLLSPLVFFKYLGFITREVNTLFHSSISIQSYIFPIGISFFTFQMIAYLIDLKRGYIQAEKNYFKLLLFFSFFPILLAGPIERARKLIPQLNFSSPFDYTRVKEGLQLILWGLFKKLVISANLALYVNSVFDNISGSSSASLWLATWFFSMQIFTDFSAYSDIAMGVARALGVDLIKNFNDRVYAASSRTQFWQGWHISLTSWFRDYIFLPLSKGKPTKWRLYLNLMFVYLLTGLWHGASWGFILWGLTNGLWLVIEQNTKKERFRFFNQIGIHRFPVMLGFIGWFVVFNAGCLMGIFFRAETYEASIQFYQGLFAFKGFSPDLGMTSVLFTIFISIAAMDLLHRMKGDSEIYLLMQNKPRLLRWSIYFIVLLCILYLKPLDISDYYYFRF